MRASRPGRGLARRRPPPARGVWMACAIISRRVTCRIRAGAVTIRMPLLRVFRVLPLAKRGYGKGEGEGEGEGKANRSGMGKGDAEGEGEGKANGSGMGKGDGEDARAGAGAGAEKREREHFREQVRVRVRVRLAHDAGRSRLWGDI